MHKNIWSRQEDQKVLQLLKFYKINVRINWSKLSQKLNQLCFSRKRSPKQCKDRYNNVLKHGFLEDTKMDWSIDELLSLMNMYLDFGSSWSRMAQTLKHKSQIKIKNRFYWSLRRAVNSLNTCLASSKYQKNKVNINYKVITVLLDMCNQIQNWVAAKGLTIRPNSRLFMLKKEIVQYSFKQEEFTEQRIGFLIREIKEIAFDLKGHKIFRAESRGSFRLDLDFLRKIYRYDQFVNEGDRLTDILQLRKQKNTQTKQSDSGALQQKIYGEEEEEEEEEEENYNQDLSLPSLASLSYAGEEERQIQEELQLIHIEHIPKGLCFFQLESIHKIFI